MLSLNALTNIVQGVKISKEKVGTKYNRKVQKGPVVIGEAFCKQTPDNKKIEISMIRRVNPSGKGFMSLLLQEILNDARRLKKDCVIEVKPFNDPFRPFESVSGAYKRVYRWYKQFGFDIQGSNGIYKN